MNWDEEREEIDQAEELLVAEENEPSDEEGDLEKAEKHAAAEAEREREEDEHEVEHHDT